MYTPVFVTKPAFCRPVPDRVETGKEAVFIDKSDLHFIVFAVRIVESSKLSFDRDFQLQVRNGSLLLRAEGELDPHKPIKLYPRLRANAQITKTACSD